MKLDVHQQIHCDAQSKRMITMEGIKVCMTVWRQISGTSESTVYLFQEYAARGDRAPLHGNLRIQKTQKHTLQAIATLKCVLDKLVDYMPYCMHTLPSIEKVVSKVLPTTFLWKETLLKVNATNVVFALKEVSTSNINNMKKLNFREYCVKKLRDNFACCAICDRFYAQRRTCPIELRWK